MKTLDVNNKEVDLIEKKLDLMLRPVNPEEGYVSKLKHRLISDSNISIDKPEYSFILLFAGLLFFFGVFLVWILNLLFHKKAD